MLRGRDGTERFLAQLPTAEVVDLDDGGMGSFQFVSPKTERRFGRVLAETQYADADGVPVLASLYLDREGELYELDSWKVDYSPLRRIPLF
ncbi:DUF6984 family protein [Hymenobacter sp. B81]|uniref:DUF6984 family protein n=1 Tax=Hymenobacter sp. B81 TaxID=3344878 RepID=UPI0037DD12D5